MLLALSLNAQHKISGTVYDEFGNTVSEVEVKLKNSTTHKVTQSDQSGKYSIENVKSGAYKLIIKKDQIESFFDVKIHQNDIELDPAFKSLRGIELATTEIVKFKSIKSEIEKQGFAVSVIETKEAALRNIQTNELLDRTAGVRLRQNGGLGASVDYNLNGMSGNSVKIFIDGIPISTYGSSFNLNSIPPAIIERIEVYKGVVPGYLADDALGGAINVILKKGAKNRLNASISYGSFNTTQSNVNGLYRDEKSGLTFKASAFMNYSDNDYEVWGDKIYNILPNGQYEYITAKRFNDAFRSNGSVVELGFTEMSWADNFFIGYTRSELYNEIQHGQFMTIPYKGRFNRANNDAFSLTYNKKDLFTKGLNFNVHAVHGERNTETVDTVKWNYNWNGEIALDLNGNPILRPNGAQQGAPTMANINRKNTSIRAGINYEINKNHRVFLDHSFNNVNRVDDDLIRTVLERNYMATREMQKNISSLTYEFRAFHDKLKLTAFGKYYDQTLSRMNPTNQLIDGVPTRVEDVKSRNINTTGYGGAISYLVAPAVSILTSAERAVRLPSENEVFGDPSENIEENVNLKPEISNNFNLGFKIGPYKLSNHKIALSANGFIRDTRDRIAPQVQSSLNSNLQTLPFENQGKTNSIGFDAELNYTFKRNLNIILNATKFDLTYNSSVDKRKVPNEPTFVLNGNAQYSFKNLIGKGSQLNLYYHVMWVDSFLYLQKPYENVSGYDRFYIPEQFINDAGLSYVFPNKKFILSFDAKNIFNQQAFDNMAVQKPGRAFYLKLNYQLNNL